MARKLRSLGILSAGAMVLATAAGALAVPPYLSEQGRLFDDMGEAVADGTVSITFSIYAAATGGAAIWTETQMIQTEEGYFSAVLGDSSNGGTAIPPAVFNGSTRYLGVKVGSDSEMTPRQPLVSVPYALVARGVVNEAGNVVINPQGQWVGSPTGLVGPTGPAGSDGARGPTGPAGSDGARGATGPQGPQGIPGTPGASGVTGPAGPAGPLNTRAVQATGTSVAVPTGSTAVVTVRQVTITVPSSGRVLVTFNGVAETTLTVGDYWYLTGQVMASAGTPSYPGVGGTAIRFPSDSIDGIMTFPFGATNSFPVTAGTHTFYFQARNFTTASPTTNILSGNMEAIFIPQ